ncbi:MAG: hypothetical protein VX793_10940 [Pseudomonadota bacterium]|nr:hypothetical protein [Pseudomonadota bacterium]
MKHAIVAGMGVVLAACGGSGSSGGEPSHSPVNDAHGVYRGNTDTGRALVGLVLKGGGYYLFYGEESGSDPLAGVIHGRASATRGTFASAHARDVSLEGGTIRPASISASYIAGQYLTGGVDYDAGAAMGFTTSYEADYDNPADPALLPGKYFGRFKTTDRSQYTAMTLTESGTLSAETELAGGCDFDGLVVPRPEGNVFRLTLTFADPDCRYHGQTLQGSLYRQTDSGIIYGAALTADREGSVFFYVRPPL